MEITKPMLETQLATLRGDYNQLIAKINVVSGAIKQTELLLATLDKPAPLAIVDEPTTPQK